MEFSECSCLSSESGLFITKYGEDTVYTGNIEVGGGPETTTERFFVYRAYATA
jgi:hypothetical protein